MKVLFLTVLYSVKPCQSKTVKSLIDFRNVFNEIESFFVFWDNSKQGFAIDYLSDNLPSNFEYLHTGINERLSVIYNLISKKYSENFDYIVLLDDDSILDANYIENLKNAISHRANVAIPLIFHDKKLISPGAISGVKGRVVNRTELNLGFNNNNNIVAMMSGTLIRTAVLKKIKFDERLSFYGVDTKFFIDYQQKFNSIYIMDCSMEHDSALRTKTGTPTQNYNRLMMLVSSWRYVYDHVFLYRTRLTLRIVLFSLKHIVLMKNLIPGKLLKLIIPIWKK